MARRKKNLRLHKVIVYGPKEPLVLQFIDEDVAWKTYNKLREQFGNLEIEYSVLDTTTVFTTVTSALETVEAYTR